MYLQARGEVLSSSPRQVEKSARSRQVARILTQVLKSLRWVERESDQSTFSSVRLTTVIPVFYPPSALHSHFRFLPWTDPPPNDHAFICPCFSCFLNTSSHPSFWAIHWLRAHSLLPQPNDPSHCHSLIGSSFNEYSTDLILSSISPHH